MNTEFKGTLGVWEIHDNASKLESTIITDSKRICEVKSYGINTTFNDKPFTDPNREERKANAQLIATAPELLEALIELIQVKEWKDKYGKDAQYLKAQPTAWENAKKVIQKALNP